jgi:NADH-quinone oxidoreductase subunit J
MLLQWGGLSKTSSALPAQFDGVGLLGESLTSANGYVLPFEVASVLLLAAMVGAVYLAFNKK